MKISFANRVMRERTVDTRKYRYVFAEYPHLNESRIERLPLELLDTTGAYSDWETVKIYTTNVIYGKGVMR